VDRGHNQLVIEKSDADIEMLEQDDIRIGRGMLCWRER